ncbi:MAG: DUF2617 family protein [Chloroflexota bacterium]
MEPIYQHPRDLTLALFCGEPTFRMTLLRSRRVNAGPWDVHFHIIGESHAAIFSYERTPVFSEVLACVDVERAFVIHRFESLEPYRFARGSYGVTCTADRVDWQKPASVQKLEVQFPPMFGQVPMTRLQWQLDQQCIRWWTLHTYPLENDMIAVKTMSYFDFAGGKQWV